MVRCVREFVLSSDCGWVDYVQSPMPSDWNSINYVYDPGGRRIAKSYDGQAVMKYVYDGHHIIAEYDATGALVHKYIYGPGVDQPICMIDVADANATYYYHFDGLGSVIALTDSAGAVTNLYEYSIFGEVSASDPNHPNRFLFTGREFDSETGLYYYRARYYNPYIGRFLQTDPAGYAAGMNLYGYCWSNPTGWVDPSGWRAKYTGPHYTQKEPTDPCWEEATGRIMVLPWQLDPKELSDCKGLAGIFRMAQEIVGVVDTVSLIWDAYGESLGSPGKILKNIDWRIPAVELYLRAAYNIAGNLPGVIAKDTNYWRVFIEIQPWTYKQEKKGKYEGWWVLDDNGDYVREKNGDPYWVEVKGILPVTKAEPGKGWRGILDGAGYETAEEALAVGLAGVGAYGWWTERGSLPNKAVDPQYGSDDYYSGSYKYTGPSPSFAYTGPEPQ